VHFKRKLAILTTAVAAAAFAGGAYAATQDSTGNERQAFLNDVAKRLNVTPQELAAALKGAYQDQLNAAVKAGKLTQAQANALAQRFQNPGSGPVGGMGPLGLGLRGLGANGGANSLFEPPNGPGHGDTVITSAAKYLGLSDTKVAAQVQSGVTLAQVATARGKSVSGLEQAITAAFKTRLEEAVASKRITGAQEQKLLSSIAAGVKQEVNETTQRAGPRAVQPGDHPGRWGDHPGQPGDHSGQPRDHAGRWGDHPGGWGGPAGSAA
jgi:hypothetical protein